MKILYSLPHPSDRLVEQRAGHMVRASALLENLQKHGHDLIRSEAAVNSRTNATVNIYRKLVRRMLPASAAMRIRDHARIRHGRKYAESLLKLALEYEPDVILETHIAFSLAGKIVSETTGIPLVLDDCSPGREEELQYGVGLPVQALEIHREVTRHARLVVAVNQTMRGLLVADGVRPESILIVENGYDDSLFHPGIDGSNLRTLHGIPETSAVIIFVGSFQPYHKVELLLNAFNKIKDHHDIHLLLVGDGRTLQQCISHAKSIGIQDRVTFSGRIPYHQVPQYIAAGDIAVMPATNDYGNPMKIYEYMALGKAVVAPDQPTIGDLVTHGKDCYLFVPDDVASLGNALRLLALNRQLRTLLGENAAGNALNHSWRRRAETLGTAMMRLIQSECDAGI